MLSSAPSFTVLTSTNVKDEVTRPPSPKRTITSTSTSMNNIPNKRSASASKSPATTATKKKRLTMTNNVQSISPTIRHTSTMDTSSGQNRKASSVDDMIFFEKVKLMN
jgi:chromatin segregation and condensation protein Rec8/ScpA/Scc1 (kleisin family)